MTLEINFQELNIELKAIRNIWFKEDQIYEGSLEKYWLECGVCGNKWGAVYSSVIHGSTGCPKCSHKKAGNLRRLNINFGELNIELKATRNIWFLENQIYNGSHEKYFLECGVCNNIWDATYNDVVGKNKTGCPKCRYEKISNSMFLKINFLRLNEEIRETRKFKFIEGQIYTGSTERYNFECLVCGNTWNAVYYSVINMGTGCRKCAVKEQANKIRGINNVNWKGGRKYSDYPEEWYTGEIQEYIRNRDFHRCQYPNCNYSDLDENNYTLDVHHINGDKQNCKYYNLISLCNKHHGKIEMNNPRSWEEYFYEITNSYEL